MKSLHVEVHPDKTISNKKLGNVKNGFGFLGFSTRLLLSNEELTTTVHPSTESVSRRDSKVAGLSEHDSSKKYIGQYLRRWLGLGIIVCLAGLSSTTYAAQTCFVNTGAIENWTVPPGVNTITAEAYGAQGGNSTWGLLRNGGLGAYVVGDISVTPGTDLKILVGGQGESLAVGGGGGGSFISTSGDSPLIVAGGGGGASSDQDGVGGVITEAGTADSLGIIPGGTSGNGANVCGTGENNGGGGGGFNTNGTNATNGITNGGFGGIAFINGGTIVLGGRLDNACVADPAGGFGGGGSATCNTVGGGGGGGYSGGAGGSHLLNCGAASRAGGGGGGSFNIGTNQTNTPAINTGDGSICLTYFESVSSASIPTLSFWGLFLLTGLLGFVGLRRQRNKNN
ncbi:glycine rich domain-containing protein [uncultured Cocleimonas sp.]|uniref:glycine rich domain-containing protein n=1 Tax=uncultured Cocleimonas sp. TaxID=1051587 RepID=UPI0026212C06|nr:glycine rich domain-containing protein [uncultured Cocleimonas sp.]